jgi:hypothetical protein
MAYQDDFRNKVLAALKAKNLAVDISQEATQQAIVEEVQNVAASESRPMSPEEMKLVLQDVATQLAVENGQLFTAQSYDFTAFGQPPAQGGSYSGGGIAASVMNKDIIIIPTAGTATSINTLSQIDFKIISNPNAYGVIDPNEVKSSLYNWGERISGNTYDTPVLGLGGAWNGVSYTPTSSWGIGGSQGSGIGGSINTDKGFGQVIYFKPATSSIYASIFNDLGLDTSYTNRTITITGYQQAVPGSFPTSGLAITFGGIGNSGDLVIQGAISDAQTNTIKFLSPFSVSNATATDNVIIGMSSQAFAGGTQNVYFPGGTSQTSAVYVLATNTSTFALGDIFYSAGVGHTTLARLPIGGNGNYLSSTGSTPQWTNTISATTVSVAAATGSTILYPLLNNVAGAGSAVSTDIDFSVDPGANILRYSNGSFYVGTAVSSPIFTSIANVAIRPGSNSQTAIQFQSFPLVGTASTALSIDTSNSRVSINPGTTSPTYTLEVYGDTNISTGSVFRIAGTSVLSSNTLGTGVITSSLTSVGTLTGGTWSATTIAADKGGTGQASYTVGDILYASSTSALSKLGTSTTGYFLASSGGPGAAPAYVNSSSASFTFTGGVAFNTIAATTNVTPSNANDLANKAYVDSISGGLDPHASVRLTTISAIGGSYRQAGTAGTLSGFGDYILATTVAEVLTTSVAGFDTPASGFALTYNQRVLIKDGVSGGYASGSGAYGAFPTTYGGIAASYVANGIYTVNSIGGAATSGWLLIRATDTDNNGGVQELTGGTFTFIEEGTNFADNAFVCTNDTTSYGSIGFGATQITWSAFSGGASLTMGQGLSKAGNTVATNYNIATVDSVTTNLSRGFSIGGARSGSVGSSSYDTFTFTGSNSALGSATLTVDNAGYTLAGGETAGTVVKLLMRGVVANNTITGAADGWTHAGGTALRTLTVIGGDILLNGGGFGLTLSSNSVLSTNNQTLALTPSMGSLTFNAGNTNPVGSGSTQSVVQSGVTQYILSTSTGTFTAGDIYYGAGTAFTALARLAFGSGTGNSVLIRGASQPTWGTIALANSDFVSGILAINNGGTNANSSNFTANGVVIYDSANTRLTSAIGLTMLGGTGLSVTGTVSASLGYFVGSTAALSGVAGQVAFYGTSNTAIGNTFLAFSPTAVTGTGLSVGVNSSTGTIFSINTSVAMTAGNLIDFDINGVQRFGVDWKGMATHTNNSSLGNTALVVAGGRTILPAPTANYASLNLAASSAVNPGAGITQIGDLWFNGTNLYFRKDAATNFDLLVGSVSGSGTTNKIAKWSSTSGLTDSNISDAGFGMTITSASSIATAGSGATALLTLQSLATDDNKTDRYFIRGMSTGAGGGTTRYFSIDTAGNLRATTKSFDIPHPTKEGLRLVYGVLEGPEHGVYHRGTVEGNGVLQVNLPDYWHKLVGDQYTIQITPWGNYNVVIDSKTENYFTIQLVGDIISRKFKNIKVDYIVHGSRLDAPLETEQ